LRKAPGLLLAAALSGAAASFAAYAPNHKDSGWVRLFNGKDLTGLYPHVTGSQWGQNPNNIVTVHDSLIHTYQGYTKASHPPAPNGIISTDIEFGYYVARLQYRHGDFANNGWIAGDPWNAGFFFHSKPEWPPCIENQLKIHWNSKNGGKPCTAAAGDCDQLWAGDYWILNGVQITNKDGQLTQLGGCCQPALTSHNPDYELEDWNTMEIQVYGDSLFRNLLNGHETNHGTKATWQNPQGQRVPLKKGRLQLELEGSEFLFRNWEIRLLRQDSLYSIWYKEGCMDPSFQEYSAAANLHVKDMCKTAATAILDHGNLELREAGGYEVAVHDASGRLVARYRRQGPSRLAAGEGLEPGIYFLDIRSGSRSSTLRMDRF
jgi:hypothetical protein